MSSEMRDEKAYRDDYFGILDVVVVLAESWLILLMGVILAGGAALLAVYLEPKTYVATAKISLTPVHGALLSSPAVLDPVAAESGILAANGDSPDAARDYILSRRTLEPISSVGLYDITMKGRTREEAKQVLEKLFSQLGTASRPKGAAKQELEEAAVRLKKEIADIESIRRAFVKQRGPASNSPGRGSQIEIHEQSFLKIQQEMDGRRTELATVKSDLEGFGSAQIVQPPIAHEQPLPRNKRKPVFAAVSVTTMFLLALVFLREFWRRASVDPVNGPKLRRIKRAFWLPGTKPSAYES